jgi:hypothetical protein
MHRNSVALFIEIRHLHDSNAGKPYYVHFKLKAL